MEYTSSANFECHSTQTKTQTQTQNGFITHYEIWQKLLTEWIDSIMQFFENEGQLMKYEEEEHTHTIYHL